MGSSVRFDHLYNLVQQLRGGQVGERVSRLSFLVLPSGLRKTQGSSVAFVVLLSNSRDR